MSPESGTGGGRPLAVQGPVDKEGGVHSVGTSGDLPRAAYAVVRTAQGGALRSEPEGSKPSHECRPPPPQEAWLTCECGDS